ncbi:MAG: hypothetical protein ACKOAD_00310 [Gammaproteobacteria bacterium]
MSILEYRGFQALVQYTASCSLFYTEFYLHRNWNILQASSLSELEFLFLGLIKAELFVQKDCVSESEV